VPFSWSKGKRKSVPDDFDGDGPSEREREGDREYLGLVQKRGKKGDENDSLNSSDLGHPHLVGGHRSLIVVEKKKRNVRKLHRESNVSREEERGERGCGTVSAKTNLFGSSI